MPKKTTMTLKKDYNQKSGPVYRVTFPKQFGKDNRDLVNKDFRPRRTLFGNIKLVRVR